MSDRPVDRRRFFRQSLAELFKPLVKAAEPIERALAELDALDRGTAPTQQHRPAAVLPVFLRPPGALPERAFRDTCSRCGVCVSVCPASAIKLDTAGVLAHGVPYVVASEAPCVICDGLHCMQNCPSGALVFTPAADIDMGTAEWHEQLCVRSRGEECRICVDQCPIGEKAITLDGVQVKVLEAGCTGCGVCEHYCPTDPKSITIMPRAMRDNGTVSR